MAADESLVLNVSPFGDLEEFPNEPLPTHATVREINARVVDNEISFFFSRANYEVDLGIYDGGFAGLLRDLRTGEGSFPDFNGIRPQPPIPPLSLKNRDLRYVVYVLQLDKNWQFSRDHAPFSTEEGMTNPIGARRCHYGARRVDPNGNQERVIPGMPAKDNCMVAYFVSNGAKAASGTTGRYTHPLNIHVDLLFGAQDKGRIPLIIDPDIRFPGGSGP